MLYLGIIYCKKKEWDLGLKYFNTIYEEYRDSGQYLMVKYNLWETG
jgi:hypothetical protein